MIPSTSLLVLFSALTLSQARVIPNIDRLTLSCPSSVLPTWDSTVSFTCKTNLNFQAGDITGILAFSVEQCADACATSRKFMGEDKGCDAFTFDVDVARSYSINNGANCWLKRKGETKGENSDWNGVSGVLVEEEKKGV